MEQNTSNSVNTDYEESNQSTDQDKPIMNLFKRLINNDFKQTNAQIFDLLKKEFKMNMHSMHELEVDIYLNIMKKFLKEWPLWDEFDLCFNNQKHADSKRHVDKILSQYYVSLKQYIEEILMLAKPLVSEAMQKVISQSLTTFDTKSDAVLEVTCSRTQLNHLVLRQPNTMNCIFVNINTINTVPKNIKIVIFPLSSILDWFNVSVHIILKNFRLTYIANHKLTHMLVNKKHNAHAKPLTTLDLEIQIENVKKSKNYHKRNLFGVLKELIKTSHDNEILTTVYKSLEEDLRDVEIMKFPSAYKKHLTKYPYRRYLYTEIGDNSVKDVDCQMEETIVPIHEFFVSSITNDLQRSSYDWFRVECGLCKVKFPGTNCAESLKEHFVEYHNSEPNWQCLKCEGSFKMLDLASRRWQHACTEPSLSS